MYVGSGCDGVSSQVSLVPKRIVFRKPPSVKLQINLQRKSKWITFYIGWMKCNIGDGYKMKYHVEARVPFYWVLTVCLKGAGLCVCYILESSQLVCEVGMLPWGSERRSHTVRFRSHALGIQNLCFQVVYASCFSHLSYFSTADRMLCLYTSCTVTPLLFSFKLTPFLTLFLKEIL